MTEPFGEHTCACGQPADRHRFVGGWMCGACAEKQDHPWMQENPMTPPDRPAQPAPDLDALLDTFYKTQQYADMGDEERKPPRQVIADAARAAIVAEFTSLRERVAALEAALEQIAESTDRGRHDGLPAEGPAYDDPVVPWVIARNALKGK